MSQDDHTITNAKDKATALNDQFQSVFTVEGLTNMPEIGPDGIHLLVLKHCSNELEPILKVIFVQSLNTCKIPSDWLLANVTPVYKKGSKDLPVNNHPISLTVCSKVMEHVIYHSIMNHLNHNDVLSSSQHGFLAGYSCSTQLVLLTEDLHFHMDPNTQIDMILLDFLRHLTWYTTSSIVKETEILSY